MTHPRQTAKLYTELRDYYLDYGSGSIGVELSGARLYWASDRQVRQASYMASVFGAPDGLIGYQPYPKGLIYLDHEDPRTQGVDLTGGPTVAVRAYTWTPRPDDPELMVAHAWARTDELFGERRARETVPGATRQRAPLTPIYRTTFEPATGDYQTLLIYGGGAREVGRNPFTTMFTLWYRLTEPRFASVSVSEPTAKERRKAERAGVDPAERDVTVIDARPAPRRPSSTGTGMPGRVMDYQEDVAGHPKWVHYGPNRSLEKRIWVDSYPRGPKGAPRKEDVRGERQTVRKLS